MKGFHRIGGFAMAASLFLVACSPSGPIVGAQDPGTDPPSQPTSTTTVDGTTDSQAPSGDISAVCRETGEDASTWQAGISATAETLQERTTDQPGVEAVVYPRADYNGKPWSQWGQGIALGDGRFISAIGDSIGADGNSFIYEYDPETRVLTQFADALTVADADHEPGAWGYGKIHAKMVEGPCGDIYLSTYWGTRRGLEFSEDYQGDVLLRLDPENRTIENLGVILAEHGVASLASWPEGGLLYAEAADPFGKKTGSFIVIDATTGDLLFEDDDPSHGGYRSIAVDSQGRAYITWEDDGLARYDPATNTLEILDISMPGAILRWATQPDDTGTMYAVSRDPAVFFRLDEQGEISELVPARGYTTSMGISPDGGTFYYVPDAHGAAWEQGTSLIAVDTTTGEETVVVELNPLIESQLGLRAGGTYNVVVDPSGERIYVGLNAGDPATRDTFGEVVLAIVTLP